MATKGQRSFRLSEQPLPLLEDGARLAASLPTGLSNASWTKGCASSAIPDLLLRGRGRSPVRPSWVPVSTSRKSSRPCVLTAATPAPPQNLACHASDDAVVAHAPMPLGEPRHQERRPTVPSWQEQWCRRRPSTTNSAEAYIGRLGGNGTSSSQVRSSRMPRISSAVKARAVVVRTFPTELTPSDSDVAVSSSGASNNTTMS